ncbi:MAG: acylphosphatase [Oscillospiraceae bacterium]|nr:acylphosphatase [Oscillospiraceae bacterium]
MERTRLRIRFHGRVQGVGFRYRAYHAADSLGLTGWVKNCSDGTVLAEIQGIRSDIERMIAMVGNGTYIDITDTEIKNLPVDSDEYSFKIKDY